MHCGRDELAARETERQIHALGGSAAASLSVFNRVEDVADVAAFLASSDSRWITGQCIDVTGGTLVN